jgi:hypothetical protein
LPILSDPFLEDMYWITSRDFATGYPPVYTTSEEPKSKNKIQEPIDSFKNYKRFIL